MNILKLFTGDIGGTVKAVTRGVAMFTGDNVQREGNGQGESMAVYNVFASENMQVRANRMWWDRLIDGLNRLPRPLIVFAVLGLLVWPLIDPVKFSAAMQAYALVPEWLAYVFIAIVSLYFPARTLEKIKLGKGDPTPDQIQAVLDTQKCTQDLAPPGEGDVALMSDDELQIAMSDTSKPLSDKAILEWNRRKKEG